MTAENGKAGWRVWLAGIAAVLILLWVGYWYTVQTLVANAVERATAASPEGPRIACAEKSVGGFPLRVSVRCIRANYAEIAEGGIAAEIGGIEASGPLYWPGAVDTVLTGPLVLNSSIGGLALTAAWSDARSSVEIGVSGLQRASASLVSFDFGNGGAPEAMPVKALRADRVDVAITPRENRAYRLDFATRALQVTQPDGRSLPAIDSELRLIALDYGETLGNDPGEKFLEWLRQGGTADIERVRLATSSAAVEAAGKLTLSPAGLLSGSLTVRARNLAAVPDMIDAIQPGSREFVVKLVRLVSAFMLPVETPEGPQRQTVLNFRDGVVAVGALPIGAIPALQLSVDP